MKARELMEKLLDLSPRRIEDTVDTLKAGDPDKEVHKVATGFIASWSSSARRPRGARTSSSPTSPRSTPTGTTWRTSWTTP